MKNNSKTLKDIIIVLIVLLLMLTVLTVSAYAVSSHAQKPNESPTKCGASQIETKPNAMGLTRKRTNRQNTAHEIAQLARSIGLPEDDVIIQRAQELWNEDEGTAVLFAAEGAG